MTVQDMRERYEEIKRTWRAAGGRDRDADIAELGRLADLARASTEDGSEAIQMEIEDLIAMIRGH